MIFDVQYRREQRVNREVEASSAEEAVKIMEKMLSSIDLTSTDDESDDPGEIEATCLESTSERLTGFQLAIQQARDLRGESQARSEAYRTKDR